METVDDIIACHNQTRVSFFHRNFKSTQIQLPQRPFRDDALGLHPLVLLIVAGKMLDRSGHAIFMHPPQLGSRQLSGNKWVFRKILKIPAV